MGEAARSVRDAVFIQEQGISEDLEHDIRDAIFDHVVVFVKQHSIATGRIDSEGKIGRVAVLPPFRRKGHGKAVMEALEMVAREKHFSEVFVHAQSEAVPFYLQLGYRLDAGTFFEARILHQRMRKLLMPL